MWVRSGECCRCGECCIGIPVLAADADPKDLIARKPVVPGKCPLFEWHHKPDGNKVGTCIGHLETSAPHPYYLQGCNVWPTVPHHIVNYPSCTYKFTWVDD